MQKGSAIIWVVIAAIVLVGGGAAAYVVTDGFNFQDTANQQTEEAAQTQEQEEPEDDSSLLRSALAGNATITCDFTSEGGSGTAYLKKNRDFSVEQNTPQGKYRLLKQGDMMYIWLQGQNQGFKLNPNAFEDEMEEEFAVFNPETFEQEAEASSIDCRRSGSFDQSLFTVPDDVQFMSPGSQIPQNS